PALIFLLLMFITGPGEEIFWRGFLQENLMAKYGKPAGWLLATFVYGSIHIFSLNFMLTMAAFVAGAFWGAQYLWRRDLTALIISHSVWSAVIFAVFPVH
ncbi:MAG: CPBP family intramembrane metalloprotease, partial [Smithellaceae bacterium]|nr:CPBP family intramembrane metalloprotease [Smithellaceae bacterium]